MTKKALITQAELKRFANLAASEGVTIEIEREGTTVRIMPFHPTRVVKENSSREEQAERALAKWIDGKRGGTSRA